MIGPKKGARQNTDIDGVMGEERQMNCWEKRKEGGEGQMARGREVNQMESSEEEECMRRGAHIWSGQLLAPWVQKRGMRKGKEEE